MVKGVGLLACWDCGFKSHQAYEFLPLVSVVCCQVSASGWSLFRRSPTECGVSECDRKASIMRRLWPSKGCCVMGKCVVDWYRNQLQDTPTWECLYAYGTWQSVHNITSGLLMAGILKDLVLEQTCVFQFNVPNYTIFTGVIKHHQLLWSDIPKLVPRCHTASLGLFQWTQADSSSTKSAPWSIPWCDRGTAYVICIMHWNNSHIDQPKIYQCQA